MTLHILDLPGEVPGFSDKVTAMARMFPEALRHGSQQPGPVNFDDPVRWRACNRSASSSLAATVQHGDIILNMAGAPQRPVTEAFPHVLACEAGIGYRGHYLPYRVWESYSWMHHQLPLDARESWFDEVIPPAFDPSDWRCGPKGDYLLYLGRLSEDKGVLVAAEIARAAGRRLVVAGSGPCIPEGVECIGPVSGDAKVELIAGAQVVLMPTLYQEPFGRVAIEAMLCGTPVLATDWGAFTETVTPGLGARFRSLDQALRGLEHCLSLDPAAIRQEAIARWSYEAVRPRWESYFARLATLHARGWYQVGQPVKL